MLSSLNKIPCVIPNMTLILDLYSFANII
jgi:hypothetical protein